MFGDCRLGLVVISWILKLIALGVSEMNPAFDDGYFPDENWSHMNAFGGDMFKGGLSQLPYGPPVMSNPLPNCVDIPKNMSLCYDVGYHKMRLPNLLEHDTMVEVAQQSNSWVPLRNIKCHPDTQLFLCSLFAPVCLERPIYPCRSLCEQVRTGCESRMRAYGFPWPEMLKCHKFPVDNDMCIQAQSTPSMPRITTAAPAVLSTKQPISTKLIENEVNKKASRTVPSTLASMSNDRTTATQTAAQCNVCTQPDTYDNILAMFCKSDYVIKARIRKVRKGKIFCRKAKIFKMLPTIDKWALHKPTLHLDVMGTKGCCEHLEAEVDQQEQKKKPRPLFEHHFHRKHHNAPKQTPYLLMGDYINHRFVPTLIIKWKAHAENFKNAVKVFRSIDCGNAFVKSRTPMATTTSTTPLPFGEGFLLPRGGSTYQNGDSFQKNLIESMQKYPTLTHYSKQFDLDIENQTPGFAQSKQEILGYVDPATTSSSTSTTKPRPSKTRGRMRTTTRTAILSSTRKVERL